MISIVHSSSSASGEFFGMSPQNINSQMALTLCPLGVEENCWKKLEEFPNNCQEENYILHTNIQFFKTKTHWLVQKGVSIFEVSKLLGHSDIRVTEIYSQLRAEDLLNSVNRLNN